jgi:phage terminase large subunit-like protein
MGALKMPYLPNGPDGHYPLAIQPQLEVLKGEHIAGRISRAKYHATIRNTLSRPIWQYRPLPRAEEFHRSRALFRWCFGGNRSSKSQSLAQEVAWWLVGSHPYREVPKNAKVWYCTVTWELCGTVLWEKLEKLLEGYKLDIVWHNKGRRIPEIVRVKTKYGESEVQFKAYKQGREIFQGAEKDLIAFDEQSPYDVYEESITRIGAGRRLHFAQAATPLKPQPWLEEKVNGGDEIPENWEVFKFPLDDNRTSLGGFIDDEEIDARIAEWPDEVVETRRNGEWGSFQGVVYTTFNRSIHVVKEEDERRLFFPNGGIPQKNWHVISSIDWGAANPFVYLIACQLPHMDDEWYIFDEYYYEPKKTGARLIKDHAVAIKSKLERWGLAAGNVNTTWSDHDAQDRFEIENEGIPTRAAKKDVIDGIESVQTVLKAHDHETGRRPRLHFAARCRNCIREMVGYRWPEGTDTKDPKEVPVKKDDHSCDAVRYLIHSEKKQTFSAPIVTHRGIIRA